MKSVVGLSAVEALAIIVACAGCWSLFSPVYARYKVSREFGDAILELSVLQSKTADFVVRKSACPNEVGNSFDGAKSFSAYSIVDAPFGFSHGCLIRAHFGSLSHTMLQDKLVELTGAQMSDGLLSWSCRTTVDRKFLKGDCDNVPVIVFP